MRKHWLLAATLLALTACADTTDKGSTVTQRQRDSAVAASKLPGAKGVEGAMRASDAAAARAAALDSISIE